MSLTIPDIMRHVRNCFPVGCLADRFTIEGGHISPGDLLLPGDWVAIRSSRHNDGVYQLTADAALPDAVDETFDGQIWLLRPPKDFLALCADIIAWEAKRPAGGLKRETFGAYSHEWQTDENGLPIQWEAVFRHRLLPYRRLYWKGDLSC